MNRPPHASSAEQPPGPAGPFDLGDTDDTLDRLRHWFSGYGDTYRVFSPRRNAWTWVVHQPEDVRRVLVTNHRNYTKGVGIGRVRLLLGHGIMTSEGEFWRRQRRMMQPAFHRRVVERFADLIRRRNAVLLDRWNVAATTGEPVNVTQCMSELALEVVLEAIFGEDLGLLVQDLSDNPFMLVTRDSRRDTRFAYEFRQLGRIVREIARRRRADGRRRFDFMQMRMESIDPDTRQGMSERELVDEVLTLVVAGHETTASALNWTWWLLARHPDAEQRLHEEQDAVGGLGPETGYASLERMPWSVAVLQESMRLYPPGWLLTRRAIGPDRLGGFVVPPGTDVFLPLYLIHRHPAHWTDPERFDPARFEAGRSAERHTFAYIPFSAGPRHCIGENFSMFEMLLHLNGAARRFRLRPVEPGPVAIEARVNLRPARDIFMRVERR